MGSGQAIAREKAKRVPATPVSMPGPPGSMRSRTYWLIVAEQFAQGSGFTFGDRANEAGKDRLAVGSRAKDFVHEFRGVVSAARNGLVAVWPGPAFAFHQALLLQPGEHGKDCGHCQVFALVSCFAVAGFGVLREKITQSVGSCSLLARPEQVHHCPFQFPKTRHQYFPTFRVPVAKAAPRER